MDIKKYMAQSNEKPLDNIAVNGGFCGIFRKITCVGDSLSSGEFESQKTAKRVTTIIMTIRGDST